MKFAVNALIWTTDFDSKSYALLPSIREHGFDGFEVPVFQPARVDSASIRRELAANSLACTVCSLLPAGISLIDLDAQVRQKARSHLADCVKVTADLGSNIMAGPLYAPVGYLPGRRRTREEWNWAVEGFQSLGETLQANGVTLALEPLNRFETFFLNTAADAARLCEEIDHPHVGVLLDTFHTNIEEKVVANAFRSLGKRLKHVHACENDRGIPGTGHVDFRGIAAALRDVGYDEWVTIESFGFAHKELAAAAAIWRDLAPTPESIPFEGIQFLRSVMGRARTGD
ncbi:MAG: sugar phosphate isomerase/epimerase [Acidobacteriia bacterium]|nr:sugar phosphate isomerase/epimerase [Terriglobia bacterium]